MSILRKTIGENIKEVRLGKGLSQEKLGEKCGFSNTTLSSYENGRREPNLHTIAIIAKQLGVSIERLYYGDEDKSFIMAEPDEGKRVVNAIYYLWQLGLVSYYENYYQGYEDAYPSKKDKKPTGIYLYIQKYTMPIKRLLSSLNEFKQNETTYPDPEQYLEMLFSSVANEINDQLKREKEIASTPSPFTGKKH